MSRVTQLLTAIDQGYRKKAWHGPNLRGALRGVDADTAVWRPAPERNNIHELVVHLAYWKRSLIRRFDREAAGSFPYPGSNFFPRNEPDAKLLKADIKLLDTYHKIFRDLVADLDDDSLDLPAPNSKETAFYLIFGCPAHDIYHAAQIQLLKRMCEAATAV
ncbi:MAG: DinB family protein [Acidobacteriota bacterium]